MIASAVSLAVGLGHMFDGGWVWWMWLMMAVGMGAMLLVFIAAVWLLVRAVKEVAGTPERRRREDRALEELRLRYARGEITSEELDERKRRLGYGD